MIDDNSKEFIKRHIGPSDNEQSKMLQHVGYSSLEDLMKNTVPEKILLKDDLNIDEPLSENDALKKLKSISKKNKIFSGTVFFIKSSSELYPTCLSIFDCSSYEGPMCLFMNSFELSSII